VSTIWLVCSYQGFELGVGYEQENAQFTLGIVVKTIHGIINQHLLKEK